MNAASNSISTPDFITVADDTVDSDSDGIPDYYHPISSSDTAAYYLPLHQLSLSNGHHSPSLNVVTQAPVQEDEEDGEEEEEEEEMRRRSESESAMRRAFLEDESRRRAPLPSDNAARVMEAMRAVSFSGFSPDWANHLDDQLQRLRPPPTSTA